jgi:hypothetical protein
VIPWHLCVESVESGDSARQRLMAERPRCPNCLAAGGYRRVGFWPPWFKCDVCGFEQRHEDARIVLSKMDVGDAEVSERLVELVLSPEAEPGVVFFEQQEEVELDVDEEDVLDDEQEAIEFALDEGLVWVNFYGWATPEDAIAMREGERDEIPQFTFGVVADDLVFIDDEQVPTWRSLAQASATSATWGDFRKQLDEIHPGLLVELLLALEPDELPGDEDPFDEDEWAERRGGDWPLGRLMGAALPADVEATFGELTAPGSMTGSTEHVRYRPEDAAAIERHLRGLGVVARENQALIDELYS